MTGSTLDIGLKIEEETGIFVEIGVSVMPRDQYFESCIGDLGVYDTL